ncbi:deoxycytidylate deaminase [Caudoviricetes sp.]|nr:deoxycytidylate deaminase [Caudoviricetes sp.]UOF82730.1 deoxycytidylate deaminase [Caudoviricetes sp.]
MDSLSLDILKLNAIANRQLADKSRLCLRRSCHAAYHYKRVDGYVKTIDAVNGHQLHSCTAEPGSCGCPHAEAKLVLKMLEHKAEAGGILVTTMSPCSACAWLIRLSGYAATVAYLEEYDNDRSGITVLRAGGIEVVKL